MTVRRRDDGIILLEGVCPVEAAEELLQMVQSGSPAPVDWSQCTQLHTAVLQVVLAAGRVPLGPCGDAWVAQWIEPQLPRPLAGS
jgi:hypothetical protein